MKVEKVSATIRYSQDTGHGAWKVVELGAEGSVDAKESWHQAQSYLYGQLGRQLRVLWCNGNTTGTGAAVNGQNGAESQIPVPAEPEPTQTPRLHWCQVHDALFKRRQKGGTVWYSHKAEDGSWCNEPEPAERR